MPFGAAALETTWQLGPAICHNRFIVGCIHPNGNPIRVTPRSAVAEIPPPSADVAAAAATQLDES